MGETRTGNGVTTHHSKTRPQTTKRVVTPFSVPIISWFPRMKRKYLRALLATFFLICFTGLGIVLWKCSYNPDRRFEVTLGARGARNSASVIPGYEVVYANGNLFLVRRSSLYEWDFKLWWIPTVTGLLAMYCFGYLIKKKRSKSTFSSLCTVCGYDIRATPNRCPECGSKSNEGTGNGVTTHYSKTRPQTKK
jgi:hypothetical protein